MKYSGYNIISRITDSENYFIINILSGNADILDSREAEKIRRLSEGMEINDIVFLREITEKGYLSNESMEAQSFRLKYFDFLDSRNK